MEPGNGNGAVVEVVTMLHEAFDAVASDGGHMSIRLECGIDTAWSAELRWTPAPNPEWGPDVSLVFSADAGGHPADVIGDVLNEFVACAKSVKGEE